MTFHKQFLNAPIIIPSYDMKPFDQECKTLLQKTMDLKSANKLLFLCDYFLGKPYLFESLGEGESGDYYQEPLYRTDAFDCVTYVDTILALYFANDFEEFKKNILNIRYAQGNIHYTARTDWFMDLEWIPLSQKLNWLSDYMPAFELLKTAKTVIDKPNWYQVKTWNALHFVNDVKEDHAQQLLMQLRNEGKRFQPCTSEVSYLSLQDGFNFNLFEKLPALSVIFIVRPNWNIRDQFQNYPQGYGTNLNISHLGLNIRQDNKNIFYHATSISKKIVCLPLEEYLKEFINSETVKGIHVEALNL